MSAVERPPTLRRTAGHAGGPAALAILALLALLCFGVPLLSQWLGTDMLAVDLANRMAEPSLAHPLGTDELGRDIALRLLSGGQVSLAVGVAAALAAAVIGTAIGLFAGFHGGRIDSWLMRLTDFVIALPVLPLLIVLAALDLNKLGVPAWIAQSDD